MEGITMDNLENNKMNEKTEKEKTNNKPVKHGIVDEMLDWAESFVFAGFVVLLVFIFLFRTVVVEGGSMNPTLYNSQRLILDHFNYEPARGDIIVANSPGLNKTIIKRCIGVAGDNVVVDYNDNTVTVNGEVLDESYLGEPMQEVGRFDEDHMIAFGTYSYVVPEGTIFAMGDNRNASRDSRYEEVGFISTEDVLGKAVFRFYIGTDGNGNKNPGKIGFLK